jgi:very-short-patch-repair endonuclease
MADQKITPTAATMLYRARELRRNTTKAEERLWRQLRSRNIEGLKFRRQHPVGSFIVDFYCPQSKLIIEVDGGSHADQQEYDQQRTEWLQARGYRVIRFTNDDVKEALDGVIERILEECLVNRS